MNQHPPDDRKPAWEGGTYYPPPRNGYYPPQQQQLFNPQFPSDQYSHMPLQGLSQGYQQPMQPAYPPQQYYQQPQQQSSYPQQWGNIQPPEGTLQAPPIQPSSPFQYLAQQWQPQPLQPYAGQALHSPQMQQPQYASVQPQMMPQQVVNVNIQQHQSSLFTRAVYFFFIGWWAGLIWLNIGYFFVATIIGLPVGLMMLNRLPVVLTLKPANQSIHISITGNTTNINIRRTQQVNFLIRVLYFLFIGCWAGLLWSYVAYMMFVLIFPIPLGVIMFNMLPTIITLRKN